MPGELPSLKELFLAALAVAPAERGAWLERACVGDVERRRHLERMLAAHDLPQSLLDRPAAGAAPAEGTVEQGASTGAEGCGTRIGPYKLLQPIGEGGMGT